MTPPVRTGRAEGGAPHLHEEVHGGRHGYDGSGHGGEGPGGGGGAGCAPEAPSPVVPRVPALGHGPRGGEAAARLVRFLLLGLWKQDWAR